MVPVADEALGLMPCVLLNLKIFVVFRFSLESSNPWIITNSFGDDPLLIFISIFFVSLSVLK